MANNTNITMDSLKKEAVRIYNGMIAVFPQFSQEETLNISELTPKFNGCYATNNSTVCFISDNEVYVIPASRSTMRALHSADFDEEYFYVPFSNGDYPKSEQFKWSNLLEKANKSYKEDFTADCEAYCDEHHIYAIGEEILANCFEIPENGVRVKHHSFENTYYPIMNQSCLDCRSGNLGHFCCNNGRVVFVYRNGKTYVAKGYRVIADLREAGYIEYGMFVPFSNGEQILDTVLNARWESMSRAQLALDKHCTSWVLGVSFG